MGRETLPYDCSTDLRSVVTVAGKKLKAQIFDSASQSLHSAHVIIAVCGDSSVALMAGTSLNIFNENLDHAARASMICLGLGDAHGMESMLSSNRMPIIASLTKTLLHVEGPINGLKTADFARTAVRPHPF